MSDPKYIVGIDLGTTHCVMAFTENAVPEFEAPSIHIFDLPQVVAPGEIQAQPLLPSFLFMPGPHDVPEGALRLPWDGDVDYAVGRFARERGAELPMRLVASAKSWLSHTGVDRTAAILPWEAPSDARRVSPVEAATRYLKHLRAAWNYHMAREDEDLRLERQVVYLTVPASFDAVARELTVRAAQAAGLHNLTLLEEPQAAFYAWLESQQDDWRELIGVGETVLVCDVGGGTTDLSLIEVVEEDGNLDLRRVAVGDHILLGGDNMDLTLAYAVRGKLAQQGTNLDQWQFRGLAHQCRKAKERLLSDPNLESEPIVILGRGSSLIGGTIRTELTRQEIETILVAGFFPKVEAHEHPQRQAKVGVREMGLPYESDPAITRHLAHFLSRTEAAFPSAVLFNGGVMKADALRSQVLEVLRHWAQSEVRELPSISLDHAVAHGATYYGLARKGRGIRIKAGTAQTYYIGIESNMPAVPGIPTPIKALCVVPFGMEEGTDAQIRQKEFGLVVGDQAVFQLLGSTTRKQDTVGEIVEDWGGEIDEIATMEAQLPVSDDLDGGTILPVWLESKVTEIGTLELWCVARDTEQRWKLEFELRS
ncbi:MAG: Hsp70 family protein [Rhodothermales bacterium]